MVANAGSTARDYAMSERNILAHLKLALLLSLFSSSIILQARLSGPDSSGTGSEPKRLKAASFPLAIVLFVLAIGTVFAGCLEYISNCTDMRGNKALLAASKPHLLGMAAVGFGILAVCVVMVIQDS